MAKISELDPVEEPTGEETVVVLADGEAKRAPLGGIVAAIFAPINAAALAAINAAVAKAQAWASQEEGEVDPAFPGILSGRNYAGLAAEDRALAQAAAAQIAAKLCHGSATGGTSNALTVTSAEASWVNAVGGIVTFVPNAANTGAATLAVDGQAPRAIVSADEAALVGGELQPGVRYLAVYAAGDKFRVLAPALGISNITSDATENLLAYRENNGRVVEVDYADGRKLIALLESIAARIVSADIGSATVRKLAHRSTAGSSIVSREIIETDVTAVAETDASGRAHMLWTPQSGLQLHLPGLLSSLRSRRAAGPGWIVSARRRSPTSHNYDLWSHDTDTGITRRLTSDTTDTFDFHDPIVAGDHCWFTRSNGLASVELAVPLAAALPNLFLPTQNTDQISLFGDSFSGPSTGQPIVDYLNADPSTIASGRIWRLAVHPIPGIMGVGGRSMTGTYYALAGGTTGPADNPPNTTYTPSYYGRSGLFVVTDDRNRNGGEADINAWCDRLEQLVGLQASATSRWLIMEPGLPAGGVGGGVGRAAWEAQEAIIRARFPNNYSPCLDYIQTEGNDGSPKDAEYVAADVWPASCYVNPGPAPDAIVDAHPSDPKGRTLYGQTAAISIISKGWNL